MPHPDGRRIVIISGGDGYIIDPEVPGRAERVAVGIMELMHTRDLLLLVSLTKIQAIAAEGLRWSTRRIAWDEMRNLRIDEDRQLLSGEAWKNGIMSISQPDRWLPFEVDLRSGAVTGGSYDGPDAR